MVQERVDIKKGELSALPNLFDSIMFEKGGHLEVKENQKLMKQKTIKYMDKVRNTKVTDFECMKCIEIAHDHSCETTRECAILFHNLYAERPTTDNET